MKKSKILIFIILSGIVLLNACTQPGPQFTDTDKDAIRETIQNALQIYNETGDIDAYTNLYYADNAVVMPPNMKPVEGHEAITKLLSNYPEMKIQYTEEVLYGFGNKAYLVGTYNINFMGAMPDDIGKYIEIWEKQEDHSWKIIFDIFNSSLPVPEEDDHGEGEVDMDDEEEEN